jgi:Tfp pilus assembly protein PilF
MSRSASYSAALIALLIGVSACTTPRPFTPTSSSTSPTATEGAQTQSATVPEATPPAESLPQPKTHTLSAATKSLVTQSRAQLAAGNDALAASTLERALRIEPNNPLLWIEMAKLRHEEGNAAQAENLAKKALSMATGDARAQASAWRVMADAYRARGRNPEARDADARAEALSTSPAPVSGPPIP